MLAESSLSFPENREKERKPSKRASVTCKRRCRKLLVAVWGWANESYRKELKYPRNWLRRLKNFARRDVQRCKKSHGFIRWSTREIKRVSCVKRKKKQREKVVDSLIYRKITSVQSSQLLLEAFGYRIQTEVNYLIAVSDFQLIHSNIRVFNKNCVVASARYEL